MPSFFSSKKILILGLFFCLYGTFLRSYQLSQKSFWLDESFTLLRTLPNHSFEQFFREVRLDNHPPFYYLVIWGWRCAHLPLTAVMEDFWVRLPSCFFSICTLFLLWNIGKRFLSSSENLWALALFASSPLYILFAQEARNYACAVCLALLSHLSFLHLWEPSPQASWSQKRFWYSTYFLSLLLGFYCFLYLLFVPLSHFIFLWGTKRERWTFSTYLFWGLPWLGSFLLFLPWLLGVVVEKAEKFSSFQASAFIYENHRLSHTFLSLFSGYFFLSPSCTLELVPFYGLIVFGYGLFFVGIYFVFKYRFFFFGAMLYLPFLFLFILPIKPHQFDPKHLLFALPFFFLILSLWTRSRWGKYGLGMLLFIQIVFLWIYYQPQTQKEDWRAASKTVSELVVPETVVVLNPAQFLFAFKRYFPAMNVPVSILGYSGTKEDLKLRLSFQEAQQVIWINAENPVSKPFPIPPLLLKNFQETSSFQIEGDFGTIWLFQLTKTK